MPMKPTGPTSPTTRRIIRELEKTSVKYGSKIWKRVAEDIERPRRIRRIVNVGKLEKYCNDGEIVVVPGKLLGGGKLTKKLTVSSLEASKTAIEKIESCGGRWLKLEELVKKYPKGSGIKIMG